MGRGLFPSGGFGGSLAGKRAEGVALVVTHLACLLPAEQQTWQCDPCKGCDLGASAFDFICTETRRENDRYLDTP